MTAVSHPQHKLNGQRRNTQKIHVLLHSISPDMRYLV